jgi:predicted dehydrogenase
LGAQQRAHSTPNDELAQAIMKYLLIGLGGIGQRHARNLRTLHGAGCDLIAYRVRGGGAVLSDTLQVDRPSGIEERYGIRAFGNLEAALEQRPDAALICNPTSMHMAAAIAAAEAGCHLLIEKPLSHTMDGVDRLEAAVRKSSLVCMIAYQLRFHPCLRLAKRLLVDGAIGRAIACRATVGEYLPGWHRYEDYRQMYASKRDLGGGVVLSQIHEIDLMYWLFGRPKQVVSVGGHFSDLEIDVEDVASTLLSYDGMVAHLHQDYLQQPPVRQIEIIGSAGKMFIDLRAASLQAFGRDGEATTAASFPELERNSMFLEELTCFTQAIRTGSPVCVDLDAGRQSLEIALAIRRSMESGTVIDMGASS